MKDELQILEDTCHPNIVRIYELLHDDNYFYIVQEYIKEGELYELFDKPIHEQDVRKIMKQVYLALNYIHKRNIVHRDIKPENILIDDLETLDVKITDFGFATWFGEKQLQQKIGSPEHMPPEIIKGLKYNSKVDIWSAGVVAYMMLCGEVPFYGESTEILYENIKNQKLKFAEHLGQSAKDFLTAVLQKDPKIRLDAEQVLAHPWLEEEGSKIENSQMTKVFSNLGEFCKMNNFKKTVISIISSLQAQKSELNELKQAFMLLDENKDGVLSIDELSKGIDKHQFELFSDSDENEEMGFEKIMKICDVDGDGQIDYAEFIQATIDHKSFLNEDTLRTAFSLFDLDGDGQISRDELKQAFSEKIGSDLIDEIMKEVDKNNDNNISYGEFNAALTLILKKSTF